MIMSVLKIAFFCQSYEQKVPNGVLELGRQCRSRQSYCLLMVSSFIRQIYSRDGNLQANKIRRNSQVSVAFNIHPPTLFFHHRLLIATIGLSAYLSLHKRRSVYKMEGKILLLFLKFELISILLAFPLDKDLFFFVSCYLLCGFALRR